MLIYLAQGEYSGYYDTFYSKGFLDIFLRDDDSLKSEPLTCEHRSEYSRNRTNSPIESELSEK